MATFGTPLWYQKSASADAQPNFAELELGTPLHLVVGITGHASLTADTVARVRQAWQQAETRYDTLFDQIADLTEQAKVALQQGQSAEVGELMNLCHGYLNALQFSTPELEELIHIARSNGALGAKLTGGGGGGSMIALAVDDDT